MIIVQLKAMMKFKGLTARKLSAKTGITVQQLSAIGQNKPKSMTYEVMEKLKLGLDCSFDELFKIQ